MFADRAHAGRRLARMLKRYAGPHTVVLGLPRGGVPVAAEIAAALDAPLDVFVVRKLGMPGQEELAMGAIASGGVVVLAHDLIERYRVPDELVEQVRAREQAELDRREQMHRGRRPRIRGKTVIVVDDGLATGATMRAAVTALRGHRPARIVVAVPVGDAGVCEDLRALADDVVCAETPARMTAVGAWYDDFTQTTDEQVRALLERAQPDRS